MLFMEGNEELNYIDCGIQSINSLHLSRNVTVLNLHANHIKRIDGLDELFHLRQLDLSSNLISRIEGVNDLKNLQTLNLSFNKIQFVTGLQNLRSLIHINLSFNEIRDISGFRQLGDSSSKLASVELQGNNLRTLNHITGNLVSCRNLRHLVLLSGDRTNPVCQVKDYRKTLLSRLKGLECLDGKDRSGIAVQTALAADMPDITEFLEFIASDTLSSEETTRRGPDRAAQRGTDVRTPKIDAALRAFQRRDQPPSDSEASARSREEKQPASRLSPEYRKRLDNIERQLQTLVDAREQKEDDSEKKEKDSSKPSTLKRTRAAANKNAPLSARSSNSSPVPTRSARTTNSVSNGAAKGLDPASVKTTIEQVLQRLENERERRYRAEDVTRRLIDQLKKVQEDTRGDAAAQASTLEATSKLREAYVNERKMRLQCEERLKVTEEELQRACREAEAVGAEQEAQKRRVALLEEEAAMQEAHKSKESAMMEKQLLDQQRRATAAQRELEIVRDQVERAKAETERVQGMFAEREETHKNELARRFALDSPELQAIIEKCVRQEKEKGEERLKHMEEKLATSRTQYVQLEDEFRMALRIEAARFNEIAQKFEKAARDGEKLRVRVAELRRKEEEARELVGQLNTMVKEKDMALKETSKSKQVFKERIANLEANVDEARRRLEQMEHLRQENKKLRGQTHAQESIIEGLRSERQLWGEELAKQGAALAQDRGRLESQLSTLNGENSRLKSQMEKEFDELKINRKIMDDQKDTIMKMKEGLKEKDSELRRLQTESLDLQRELEATMQRQVEVIDSQKETIAKLTDRKEELKREGNDLRNDLEELQERYTRELAQWSERSKAVDSLQERYASTKASWDKERIELTSERDRAVKAARTALERLQTADSAFRRQLDAKETSQRQHLEKVRAEAAEKEREANQKVENVEAELRLLLAEKESSERALRAELLRLVGGLQLE